MSPSWHIYYLLLPDLDKRQGFIDHLKKYGVNSVFHYLPLHISEKGKEYGGKPGDMPVTESVSDRLVRLPLFYDMGEDRDGTGIKCGYSFQSRLTIWFDSC